MKVFAIPAQTIECRVLKEDGTQVSPYAYAKPVMIAEQPRIKSNNQPNLQEENHKSKFKHEGKYQLKRRKRLKIQNKSYKFLVIHLTDNDILNY